MQMFSIFSHSYSAQGPKKEFQRTELSSDSHRILCRKESEASALHEGFYRRKRSMWRRYTELYRRDYKGKLEFDQIKFEIQAQTLWSNGPETPAKIWRVSTKTVWPCCHELVLRSSVILNQVREAGTTPDHGQFSDKISKESEVESKVWQKRYKITRSKKSM
jgi:hypothetical protein